MVGWFVGWSAGRMCSCSTDGSIQKFEGAVLNATVFIIAIAVVTFGLVLCFWLRWTKFIWGYMGFSGLTILAWLGGSVAIQIIQVSCTFLIHVNRFVSALIPSTCFSIVPICGVVLYLLSSIICECIARTIQYVTLYRAEKDLCDARLQLTKQASNHQTT